MVVGDSNLDCLLTTAINGFLTLLHGSGMRSIPGVLGFRWFWDTVPGEKLNLHQLQILNLDDAVAVSLAAPTVKKAGDSGLSMYLSAIASIGELPSLT